MDCDFVGAWRRILGGYGPAPTIPFVIGAMRGRQHFDDCADDGLEQFQRLFRSMAENWVDDRLRSFNYVRRCHLLGAPVFDLNGNSRWIIKGCFPSRHEPRLGFSDDFVDDRDDALESIVKRIYEHSDHASALSNRTFSRDPDTKTWIPFNNYDLKNITAVMGG